MAGSPGSPYLILCSKISSHGWKYWNCSFFSNVRKIVLCSVLVFQKFNCYIFKMTIFSPTSIACHTSIAYRWKYELAFLWVLFSKYLEYFGFKLSYFGNHFVQSAWGFTKIKLLNGAVNKWQNNNNNTQEIDFGSSSDSFCLIQSPAITDVCLPGTTKKKKKNEPPDNQK